MLIFSHSCTCTSPDNITWIKILFTSHVHIKSNFSFSIIDLIVLIHFFYKWKCNSLIDPYGLSFLQSWINHPISYFLSFSSSQTDSMLNFSVNSMMNFSNLFGSSTRFWCWFQNTTISGQIVWIITLMESKRIYGDQLIKFHIMIIVFKKQANNKRYIYELHGALPPVVFNYIYGYITTKEIWNKHKEKFQGNEWTNNSSVTQCLLS